MQDLIDRIVLVGIALTIGGLVLLKKDDEMEHVTQGYVPELPDEVENSERTNVVRLSHWKARRRHGAMPSKIWRQT